MKDLRCGGGDSQCHCDSRSGWRSRVIIIQCRMTIPCILSLEENEKDSYLDTSSVLVKVVDNVLKNPSDPKYRSLRLANPTVMSKIIPAIGAMECLFEMGFQEGEDRLILPQNAPLQKMKDIRDEILKRRETFLAKPAGTSDKKENPENKCQGETSSQQKTTNSLQNKSRPRHHSGFINNLWMRAECVMQYEDQSLQREALKLLPVAEFTANAERKLRSIQKVMRKDTKLLSHDVDVAELVLAELMSWFKNSFFSWVDSPECHLCKNKTVASHTEHEDGVRVEVYVCNSCHVNVPFPRYNDVAKLLQTRRGRCGEWANCFTFLCRVLGWDARFVYDETDHVWTEVYSHASKRWLHCDPCENVVDKPLMYEVGWNKKLSYVVAFSCDDIQDVTWRYTGKPEEVMSRRGACSESELLQGLIQIRESLQSKCSEPRRKFLQKRMVLELVEFLTPQVPNKEGYGGRTSGSMAWRLARGEVDEDVLTSPFVWTPTSAEVALGEAHVFYSATRDLYTRGNFTDESSVLRWQNGVFECKSLFRKEEKDWKMVYLARKEGSSTGKISWKFDCGDQDVRVGRIEICCSTTLYKSGKVNLSLCNETSCQIIPGAGGHVFQTEEFAGSRWFTLTAELSGGEGDSAWQHSQLFRQEMSDQNSYPLRISVKLRPA